MKYSSERKGREREERGVMERERKKRGGGVDEMQ